MNQAETPHRIDRPFVRTADEVMQALKSTEDGLSAGEAEKRLRDVGPNRLTQTPGPGAIRRFLRHFHDLLIYVLIAAAVITAALGHWIDTAIILAVVIINAVIGFIQEGKAEQALASIRKMLSPHAQVRRDGEWMEIDADQLVPGDIVRLRSGDRVPADLRLIDTVNLRIEESALTGESNAAEKDPAAVAAESGIGDRFCMAFSGTMVAAGRGTGVVTGTGQATEIGHISTMIADVQELATPLTRQMHRFGQVLSAIIVVMAAGLFGVGYMLHDFTTGELFLAAIGFAVAAIPEGLPAVMTITLALGVQRMARRKAITRRLNAVETLGSVTVICSDKTGTLTRNEMTAREVITAEGPFKVTGIGYGRDGHLEFDGQRTSVRDHDGLRALVEVMAVCNDARVTEDSDGNWKVLGEPTEGALRTLALKSGFEKEEYHRTAVIPFESENKFMATLNRVPDGGQRLLLKGAPDRLLDYCKEQRSADGASEPLDRAFWEKQIDALSAKGLRVLAAAARSADAQKAELSLSDLDRDMVFLGIVGIIDPPRPEAIEAIRLCRSAGIRVKMITGDHAGTAKSIGREMGISDGDHAVTGAELEAASDEELRRIACDNDVFARTSPEHKLRLVRALQAEGEVVAMTGDGVNDAPALKRADVGVAMGIKGTEATKEAADIVLADDNFASIERAVEEGRTIYDNLRKSILFILPTNGAESLVILYAVIFGLALPLTPVQILWVNMVTAVTLALALAFEPTEPGVMDRPPRDPKAPILGGALLGQIAFVSLLIGGATIAVFVIEKRLEMPLELARTLAVNTLVFGQIFYLFNSRFLVASALRPKSFLTNRVVWIAVGALLLLQLGFVYLPFMNTWFGSAPLEARHWLVPVGIGAVIFLIVEAKKALMNAWR